MATNEPAPPTPAELKQTFALLERNRAAITVELSAAEVAALNRVLSLETAQAECDAAGADRGALLMNILGAVAAVAMGLLDDDDKELLQEEAPPEHELELVDPPGREGSNPIAASGTIIGRGDAWRWYARSGYLELQGVTELARDEARRRGKRVRELLKRARRLAEAP